MNAKRLGIEFTTIFVITLTTSAVVTLLWNIIGHGESAIDWETSFLFAGFFGILPLPGESGGKRKQNCLLIIDT